MSRRTHDNGSWAYLLVHSRLLIAMDSCSTGMNINTATYTDMFSHSDSTFFGYWFPSTQSCTPLLLQKKIDSVHTLSAFKMCQKGFYVHTCGHTSWGPLVRCANRYVCGPNQTEYYPIPSRNLCRFCRPRRWSWIGNTVRMANSNMLLSQKPNEQPPMIDAEKFSTCLFLLRQCHSIHSTKKRKQKFRLERRWTRIVLLFQGNDLHNL